MADELDHANMRDPTTADEFDHAKMRNTLIANMRKRFEMAIANAANRGEASFSIEKGMWRAMPEEFRSHYVLVTEGQTHFTIEFRI